MRVIELAQPVHTQALKACKAACITQNHPVNVSRYCRTILQTRIGILIVRCNAYEALQVPSWCQGSSTATPTVKHATVGAMSGAQAVPAGMTTMQTDMYYALTSLLFEQVAQQTTNPAGLTKD